MLKAASKYFTLAIVLSATALQEATEFDSTHSNGHDVEMIDILGLKHRPGRLKRHPQLEASASRFLFEIYNELQDEETQPNINSVNKSRKKRSVADPVFITAADRLEVAKSNNIITFTSKATTPNQYSIPQGTEMGLTFNSNDVPNDFKLLHSVLRIYQEPARGAFRERWPQNINTTIAVCRKAYNSQMGSYSWIIVNSINSTSTYRGWLEINVTDMVAHWLKHKTWDHIVNGNQILITGTIVANTQQRMHAHDLGIVGTTTGTKVEYQPFIIGYFEGPDLLSRIQKFRTKRQVVKRRSSIPYRRPPPPPVQQIYKWPKTCERLNFTLDFRDIHMHNWVIAPKKFEAYFCGGECNFPLGSRMNATNHAIVQTLMHLKQPNLPKPCCVPTVLGAISILHYLNEDSVNLSKYPQSVAKQCGCH